MAVMPTFIDLRNPEQERAYLQARQMCDERGVDDEGEQARVYGYCLYRGFMRDTEHLRDLRARALSTQLNMLSPSYILHQDGKMERMEVKLPPELEALLKTLDEEIRAIARRYGLEDGQPHASRAAMSAAVAL